ncbi:MAG: hypothetical protein ACOC5T_02495 [Elusimicrobiota bacterium]
MNSNVHTVRIVYVMYGNDDYYETVSTEGCVHAEVKPFIDWLHKKIEIIFSEV